MLDVTPAGAMEIGLVWLVWLLLLLVPTVSVAVTVVGLGILGPTAIVGRIRSNHWPSWSYRVSAYSLAAAAVAVPSVVLLIKVLRE